MTVSTIDVEVAVEDEVVSVDVASVVVDVVSVVVAVVSVEVAVVVDVESVEVEVVVPVRASTTLSTISLTMSERVDEAVDVASVVVEIESVVVDVSSVVEVAVVVASVVVASVDVAVRSGVVVEAEKEMMVSVLIVLPSIIPFAIIVSPTFRSETDRVTGTSSLVFTSFRLVRSAMYTSIP